MSTTVASAESGTAVAELSLLPYVEFLEKHYPNEMIRIRRPVDPAAFEAFLLAQPDFGTKWLPSFLRVTTAMPVTATAKVLRRQLRQERWHTQDPTWWKPQRKGVYQRMDAAAVAAYEATFVPGVLRRL